MHQNTNSWAKTENDKTKAKNLNTEINYYAIY